jgi:FkbM family methyltransferase
MRTLVKRFISKIIRKKIFFPFWEKLNRLTFYGMNYGVASGYADYSGELYIIKKLKKDLKKGVIFDVGANVGDWSKFVIKEYQGVQYQLHMFEPSEKTFMELKKNIPLQNHFFYHRIGLGDQVGNFEIYYDYETQGSTSLIKKGSKHSEKIKMETLDSFCLKNAIESIDFLKMDIQGYEFQVLKGAKKMLEKGKIHRIQFELDESCIENRIFFKDFWDLLHVDFDLYQSLFDGLKKIENYHFTLENYRCMNYLAIRKIKC